MYDRKVEVSQNRVRMSFRFSQIGMFYPGDEFEVAIVIDPKYFAKPLSGYDHKLIEDIQTNFPCGFRDIFNYDIPGNKQYLSDLIINECSAFAGPLTQEQKDWITQISSYYWESFEDGDGVFGAGSTCPELFSPDVEYFYEYSLKPTPESEWPSYSNECPGDSDVHPDWGFFWITGKKQPDTLQHASKTLKAENCPYLIGLPSPPGAPWVANQGQINLLFNRGCASTAELSIPNSDPENNNWKNKQEWGKLACRDCDGDGLYDTDFPVTMYGSRAIDCNDENPQTLQCDCFPGSCPSGEWCQPGTSSCGPCPTTCSGFYLLQCEAQCYSEPPPPCTPNCTNKCGGASDGCDGTCNGCPTAHNCENMSCVSCGGGNEPCCLQGSECYSSLTCQNGVCSSVSVPSIDDLAAGEYHTCVVVNGESRCFGNNQDGQLGNGSTSNALTPTAVKGVGGNGTLSGVLSISAGSSHTCALLNTGKVVCWGSNLIGQLGDGTTMQSTVPVEVLGPNGNGVLSNVTEISVGDSFTCARTNGSSVYCWGQLPFGSVGGAHPEPEQLPATSNILEISAGGEHLCLRKTDDSLWCVGDNYYGQLGNGSHSLNSIPSPVQVVAALNIPLSIQGLPKNLGTEHSCAWTAPGTVHCWGSAGLSQVTGTGSGNCEGGYACERKAIVAISSSGGLAVGGNHTCSLKNGVVMCWGSNSHGQVGLNAANSCSGSNACSHQEVEVKQCVNGLPFMATKVAAGGDHTCAVTSNGLMCWGRNLNGELGNGTTVNSSCPITVSGL